MLLYTNEARENTRNEIKRLFPILSEIPGDVVCLQDVQTLTFLLRTLDDGLRQEIKAHTPDVNKAVSCAIDRQVVVEVYAGQSVWHKAGEKQRFEALLKHYPNGTCSVEISDGVIIRHFPRRDGFYLTRRGAMNAIGHFFGKGNYAFVRQYSEKGAAK